MVNGLTGQNLKAYCKEQPFASAWVYVSQTEVRPSFASMPSDVPWELLDISILYSSSLLAIDYVYGGNLT